MAAALKKIGVDHVLDGRGAKALSRDQAEALLEKRLPEGGLLLSCDHAARTFLESRYPQMQTRFAFYDSPMKVFSDYAREVFPGAKLLFVGKENGCGAEAAETGEVDWFVNERELYRIFLRTGGAPARRLPLETEQLPRAKGGGKYAALLEGKGWSLRGEPEEIRLESEGREYRALLCRNLLQAKKALDGEERWDLIRILA